MSPQGILLFQVIVDAKTVPKLYDLLSKSSDTRILKEICYVVSNVTAGSHAQVQVCCFGTSLLPWTAERLTNKSLP